MRKHVLIIVVLLSAYAFGQETEFKGDPDASFEVARKLAFDSKRQEAQDTLRFILTKYPDYHDVRSFLGTTYSWDGEYKKAAQEFDYVLDKSPERLDTWEAAINNELYRTAPYNAIKMVEKALGYFPENETLLYLQASAQSATNNKEQALIIIDKILVKNPTNEKAIEFKQSLLNDLRHNIIGLITAVDLYSEVFDPMQYYSLRYIRRTKYGSIHARFNYSERFGSTGSQVEVDMYPTISQGFYAYLNVGVSDSYLYPKLRYGAELYKSLLKGFEVSLGFRSLKYSETTNIYSGSLGWYTGNSYFLFRSYVTPGDPGASMSGSLTYRKYGKDMFNYFSVEAGMGFSPDIYRLDFEGVENVIVNLQSQKLNFGYFFSSKNDRNYWGLQAGVSHQEISFDPGSYLWIYSLSVSWDFNFK
ncbi:YaiO family outer membrane beta-barrel protein [Confluentibacter citreus]|uniref:YaiO family outer membrane beta-barrel protein n=1 Tax=Confluentibacter citreus TaxID=2007307 RepID=UPI000C294AD9|nr:YaiO family outer membrane beta-barrel protein [Confluentibacter citreus]